MPFGPSPRCISCTYNILLLFFAESSASADTDSPDEFTSFIRSLYAAKVPSTQSVWPPSSTDTIFRLVMLKNPKVRIGSVSYYDIHSSARREACQIELKDIFKDIIGKRKIILIEGAPGSGKSTLSVFICQQWEKDKLFNDMFSLVILIQLRNPAIQNAKCVAEILPKCGSKMSQQAAGKICGNCGEGVLFILDGWDELPKHLRDQSLFRRLIQPQYSEEFPLHKSAVIITSRPVSSGDLHPIVSSRIELVGFTSKELLKYFTESLDGNEHKARALFERIEKIPVVAGSCYLPLMASIFVHLFINVTVTYFLQHSMASSRSLFLIVLFAI